MRTDEERIAAMHDRADRLERQKRNRITVFVNVAAAAACLAIIVLAGIMIPGVLKDSPVPIQDQGMSASVFSSGSGPGFVVVGLLSFVLGVLLTILCYRLKQWKDR